MTSNNFSVLLHVSATVFAIMWQKVIENGKLQEPLLFKKYVHI